MSEYRMLISSGLLPGIMSFVGQSFCKNISSSLGQFLSLLGQMYFRKMQYFRVFDQTFFILINHLNVISLFPDVLILQSNRINLFIS